MRKILYYYMLYYYERHIIYPIILVLLMNNLVFIFQIYRFTTTKDVYKYYECKGS